MGFVKVLKSKIHRATVTDANLDYEGSVTIDQLLLQSAQLHEYEAVAVWNVTRGTRLETYAMRGLAGSGEICINGAAAHLVHKGDIVIIAAFDYLAAKELVGYEPKVVFVDEHNRQKIVRRETAGPYLSLA